MNIYFKSFWTKTLGWPIDDFKISLLSEQNKYNTKRVSLYGRGSFTSSVIARICEKESPRCKYNANMLNLLNPKHQYPSPKLYYAKVNDAKEESFLIIEDMHPKYQYFNNSHIFSSYEEKALLENIKVLTKLYFKKSFIFDKLSFMKNPIYSLLKPIEVSAAIENLLSNSLITNSQADHLKTKTIPYLENTLNILKKLPLKLSIRHFSPSHIVIDKNNSEAIFVNYSYFALGNCFDTYVSLKKCLNPERRNEFLDSFLDIIKFKNTTNLTIDELIKISMFSKSLLNILEWNIENKKTINKEIFDSLLENIELASKIY